jgi:hypothetical protein
MRELINWIADPIRSFPIFTILFVLMLKYYREIGTKKFAWIVTAISIPTFFWFMADHNFFLIITFPDNIPISILIVSVAYLTWYALYKCAENDKRIEAGLGPMEATPENREKVWSWPNLVYTELFMIIAGTVFLIVWAIIFKAPLEEPANPTWAPNPAKAPWYFLGLQEMLVYFDPWMAGVVLPGVIVVGLIAIPYMDTNPKGNGYYTFSERKMAVSLFLFGWLVLWLYLIIVGTFLRGPNWTFYGPFEYWDHHKVVAEYNVNLSEFLWIKWLSKAMPHNLLVRESLGIVLSFLYMLWLPRLIAKSKFGSKILENIGSIRFYILVVLVLLMTSLPIKMVLRWLFGLKYIVALPEWELNL